MFEQVKEKFLEYVEFPNENLNENTEIIKDLQMNSLDLMMMLGDFESEYDIHFDAEELTDIVTVGDFVKLLSSKVDK